MSSFDPVTQFLILAITFAGFVGLGILLYIIWPFRREPGGLALCTFLVGMAAAFSWLLAVDTLSVLGWSGWLARPSVRSLVGRGLISGAVWLTLAIMRHTRGTP